MPLNKPVRCPNPSCRTEIAQRPEEFLSCPKCFRPVVRCDSIHSGQVCGSLNQATALYCRTCGKTIRSNPIAVFNSQGSALPLSLHTPREVAQLDWSEANAGSGFPVEIAVLAGSLVISFPDGRVQMIDPFGSPPNKITCQVGPAVTANAGPRQIVVDGPWCALYDDRSVSAFNSLIIRSPNRRIDDPALFRWEAAQGEQLLTAPVWAPCTPDAKKARPYDTALIWLTLNAVKQPILNSVGLSLFDQLTPARATLVDSSMRAGERWALLAMPGEAVLRPRLLLVAREFLACLLPDVWGTGPIEGYKWSLPFRIQVRDTPLGGFPGVCLAPTRGEPGQIAHVALAAENPSGPPSLNLVSLQVEPRQARTPFDTGANRNGLADRVHQGCRK